MKRILPKVSLCLTDEEKALIDAARCRLGRQGLLRNRSEVIRAAIRALEGMNDSTLGSIATAVPQLKPGRKIRA